MLSLVPFEFKGLRHDPFSLDRFLGEPFSSFFREDRGSWSPAVEISESNEEIVLTAEVPGLEEKDIHLSVEDRFLSLSGERSVEKKEDCDCLRSERWYGKFSRTFRLPEVADVNNIRAELKSGVLTITVPKKEEAKPKQIEVKVS